MWNHAKNSIYLYICICVCVLFVFAVTIFALFSSLDLGLGPWGPLSLLRLCLFVFLSEILKYLLLSSCKHILLGLLNFLICRSLLFVNLDSWDREQLSENGNTEEKRWWEEDLWDSWEILCFGIQNFVGEDCPRKRKVRRIMLVPSLISSWWWWWWWLLSESKSLL